MSVAAFEKLFTPKPGRTLIVGSRIYNGKEDRRKRYPDAVGIDMQAGEGVDIVCDVEGYMPGPEYAHVECMSVLEHSKRPWLVARHLEHLLQPGGTIFVTVPFIWRVHDYPGDYFRFTIDGVKELFTEISWKHEAYSHRHLCRAEDIPAVRAGEDWPHFARTEACLFGIKR